MARKPADLEEELRALYAAPLKSFAAERKRRVAELKKAGRAEDAEALLEAPKPTAVAWAVNRLSQTEPERIDAVFEAADELRSANGGPDAFRKAQTQLRGAASEATDAAGRLLEESGRKMSIPLLHEIRLLVDAAAAGDDELRARVRKGINAESLQPGFGGIMPVVRAPGAKAKTSAGEGTSAAAKREAAAEAKRAAAAERKAAREAEVAERRAAAAEMKAATSSRAKGGSAEAKRTAAERKRAAEEKRAAAEEARRKVAEQQAAAKRAAVEEKKRLAAEARAEAAAERMRERERVAEEKRRRAAEARAAEAEARAEKLSERAQRLEDEAAELRAQADAQRREAAALRAAS